MCQVLNYALENQNPTLFRRFLNLRSDVEEYESAMFEVACKTPGSADFISECISKGCDVNKVGIFFACK